MKNQTIRKVINVDKNNFAPLFNLKQEDDAVIKLSICKNNSNFDITGQTVSLCAKRPNNTIVEQIDGFTINRNELDIALKNNVIALPGKIECDLEFKDAEGKMTTASFYINVDRKITGKENIQATNEISTIDEIKNQLIDIRDEMSESNESYKTAESNRAKAETSRTAAEQTRVNEFNTIKQEYKNAYELMGQYEVQEDPSQIKFRDAKGNFGKTVNLGGIWASSGMVNYGGRDYYGNSFSGETSDHGIEISKIKGNYYQKTTKGYQLFDASKLPTTSKGGATITNNGDGSFTVSGSGTTSDGFLIYKSYTHKETIKMIRAGKLTLDTLNKTYPYFHVQIRRSDTSLLFKEITNKNSSNISMEVTEEDLAHEDTYLRIGFYAIKNQTIVGGTIKPMLFQDGNGTWEEFTGGMPSPNPDYPQEVKFFKPKNIYSATKNLIDIEALLGSKPYIDNVSKRYYQPIKLKPNTNYYLYACFTDGVILTSGNASIYLVDEKDNILTKDLIYSIDDGKAITLTEEEAKKIKQFRIYLNGISKKTIDKFYLCEGEKPSEYEDGKLSTTPFDIELKALPDGTADIIEDNILTENVGKIIFDGSEDWKLDSSPFNDNYLRFSLSNYPSDKKSETASLNNCIFTRTKESHGDYEYLFINKQNIYLQILKTRLTENTVNEFKNYIKINNIHFYYKLETPKVTNLATPLIPSYYPFTNAWHDSEVEAQEFEWKARTYPLVYTKAEVDKKLEDLKNSIVAQVMGLMPTEIQSYVIENDYNNLINELEAIENK